MAMSIGQIISHQPDGTRLYQVIVQDEILATTAMADMLSEVHGLSEAQIGKMLSRMRVFPLSPRKGLNGAWSNTTMFG